MLTKVLHIMSGSGGGIASFILNKAKAVNKEKVSFDVLTYDECGEEFVEAIHAMGGGIYRMPNPKKDGRKNFQSFVNNVMETKGPYEMVHCHISGYRALPFFLIAKKNKLKRFIVHAHTAADESTPEKLIEKIDRSINRFIAKEKVSCGKKASEYRFGKKYVKKNKIMHIPNSIDTSIYIKNEKTHENYLKTEFPSITKNTLTIGHVGRFHPQKNHQFMVNIIKLLNQSDIDFIWFFIGTGSMFQEIQEQVDSKDLSEKVKFLGRRNDVDKIYGSLDVFVLPSLYEGLPTVAVESQAAGVPTILSDRITKEVDLGMELVSFLPINQHSEQEWISEIIKSKQKGIPTPQKRKKVLEQKKFSNETSALLYEEFIFKTRNHYEIE